MAISGVNLTAAGDGVNRTSYTTASISPGSNRLLLAAVAHQDNADGGAPTLSGNGLTWVEVLSLIYSTAGQASRFTVFRAMGASPSAGAVTITLPSPTGCTWVIDEFDGVDTGGTNGSSAIVQSNSNSATATTSQLAVTLAAYGSTDNRPYAAFVDTRGASGEITSEHLELGAAFHTSPQNTVETQWSSTLNDTSIVAQPSGIASVDIAGIALEIKAASVGGGFLAAWARNRSRVIGAGVH